MPKIDSNGREYIEQDGKRYYRNFLGEWEAEKDFLGNDKVNTDIFGNPKIETDIFGNQKVETDFFGNPYVEPEKKDDGGCYFTTACMHVMKDSFDDSCQELTILRNFRDTYVKGHHPEAIDEYYKTAPEIVRAIGCKVDSQLIYKNMYHDLVQATISLISKGENEDAYNLYRDYGKRMAVEYGVVQKIGRSYRL